MKQYADTHRASVSLCAPLSGRGNNTTDCLRYAVHIVVVNRSDVFRHSFTTQVTVAAYCTLVLCQTILATYKLKPAGLETLSETSSRLCGVLGLHDAQQVGL